MTAYELIKARFIEPFYEKKMGNVGVELEFPLLNMNKKPVDINVAVGCLDFFCENGFYTEEKSLDGKNAFVTNAYGDTLSFDNSYNNFEFAMNYGNSLTDIAQRFYGYYEKASAYFSKYNYLLAGMGTNPYKKYINQAHVDFPVYNMVDEFLHSFPARHSFPDFPAYLSSVQTHLDLPISDLPRAASLFARLDFVRAALFSNAIAWDGKEVLCYRDYLWENSAFPNTGKVDESFETTDDIIKSFLFRKMFNCIRNGNYITFTPVIVKDHFDGSNDNDIMQFLSFRNVEITARGTLEIRSDCAQPVYEAFIPPAFSLGILYNMGKTQALLEDLEPHTKTSKLRDDVINGRLSLPVKVVLPFVEAAYNGLVIRGKGEEKLLLPLFERAEKSVCPARQTLDKLHNGHSIDSIIIDYSSFG